MPNLHIRETLPILLTLLSQYKMSLSYTIHLTYHLKIFLFLPNVFRKQFQHNSHRLHVSYNSRWMPIFGWLAVSYTLARISTHPPCMNTVHRNLCLGYHHSEKKLKNVTYLLTAIVLFLNALKHDNSII